MALEPHNDISSAAASFGGELQDASFAAALRLKIANFTEAISEFAIKLRGGTLISHERLLSSCGLDRAPQWHRVRRILNYLEDPSVQPQLDRVELLALQEPRRGRTVLHLLCERHAPFDLIESALKLGAPPNALDNRGNTPLHALLRSPRASVAAGVLELFSHFGADPTISNLSGVSLISQAISRGELGWLRLFNGLSSAAISDPATLQGISNGVLKRLPRVANDAQATRELLGELAVLNEAGGVNFLGAVLNSEFTSNGSKLPLLHHLALKPHSPIELLREVVSLGADPAKSVLATAKSLPVFSEGTALHAAAFAGNKEAITELIKLGAPPDGKDGSGLTPFLRLCCHAPAARFEECAAVLLRNNADINARTPQGLSAAVLCIFSDKAEQLTWLKAHGLDVGPSTPGSVAQLEELRRLGIARDKLSLVSAPQGDLQNLLRHGLSIEDMAQYARIWNSTVLSRGIFFSGFDIIAEPGRNFAPARPAARAAKDDPFTRLLPQLLFSLPPGAVDSLLHSIGMGVELGWHRRGDHSHPNEAELLALLNHPQDPQRKSVGTLTDVISSIPGWMHYGIRVTGSVVNNWADIGLLTFSFPRWKYDAQRLSYSIGAGDVKVGVPSLFEQYEGFRRFDSNTDSRGFSFGPGFELQPGKVRSRWVTNYQGGREQGKFDPATEIVFYRGALVASHPRHGTIVVRNSSAEFGRDLLPHPCMFLERPKRGEEALDIRALTPQSVEQQFRSFFDPHLYRHRQSPQSHMQFLLSHLRAVCEDYAAWKFDTRRETAWSQSEFGTLQTGGHFSLGLKAVVGYLEGCSDAQKHHGDGQRAVDLPELAFVHPDLLPWGQFEFTEPSGAKASRLKVTQPVLQILKKLIDARATDAELQATGVRSFLQEAGLNTQGELVLLKPDEQARAVSLIKK